MRTRSARQLVAVAVSLAVVAAACGDDTGQDSSDDEASTDAARDGDDVGDEDDADDAEARESDWEDVAVDVGVDDETIKVGVLADLTGPFADFIPEIVEAQLAYYDRLNANGGVAGRHVEAIVENTGYDVATHQERYAGMRGEVAMISHSSGSPHTASIQPDAVDDGLVVLPQSYYSGWWDPEYGENIFPTLVDYCVEAMNGVEWLHTNRGVESLAIVSFPGEYGEDGAAGARTAAEELGLEIVWDGTGLLTPPSGDNPNPDQSTVISQITNHSPDLVWFVGNPDTLVNTMSGVIGQGFDGVWSGNVPSYSFKLLGTDAADMLSEHYIASTNVVTWGTDVAGTSEIIEALRERDPDLSISDVYIIGWVQARATHEILERAAANGDMTRAGILAAAAEVDVDFDGLAPAQTWVGTPDDYIVRESYMYEIDAAGYRPGSIGDDDAATGSNLLDGPYTGEIAANYRWDGPCFTG